MEVLPDWSYAREHIEHRSDRNLGDTDIREAWAIEAWSDPMAVVLDPDPKSRSGRGVRVIGFSPLGRLRHNGDSSSRRGAPLGHFGVEGEQHRSKDLRGGMNMNEDRTSALVAEHTAEAEESKDAPYPDGTVFVRRGARNTPVSIRLSDRERSALEQLAAAHDLGVSTLARELIVRGLHGGDDAVVPVEQVRAIIAEAIAPLQAEIAELRRAA